MLLVCYKTPLSTRYIQLYSVERRIQRFGPWQGNDMKVLNRDELLTAEEVLKEHFPKSLKVYGAINYINRNKPHNLEVVVDSWPDFKVIIYRPDPKPDLGLGKTVSCYCTDERVLRRVLMEENAVDWNTYIMFGGFDTSHAPLLKEVSSYKEVKCRDFTSVHLMYLPDSSHLLAPAVDSELESRISSLNISHVDLVNKTWRFGGDKQSFRKIKNYISNLPTCCITDSHGQPVSWILLYRYCAMGLLYTMPEHRGKGYAKVVVSTMAKRLFAEGYPVYSFIGVENEVSYRLYKSLGFTEDPAYRAAWFEFNV